MRRWRGTFAPILLEIRPVAAQASIKFLAVAKGSVHADAVVLGDASELVGSVKAGGKCQFPVVVTLTGEDQSKVGQMTVDWHVSLKR